jgi:uncharacterized membrane protein YoaK (UPF0700 family)
LAAAPGSADSWSYFGRGHAFVANMTGNTVPAGHTIFSSEGLLRPSWGRRERRDKPIFSK